MSEIKEAVECWLEQTPWRAVLYSIDKQAPALERYRVSLTDATKTALNVQEGRFLPPDVQGWNALGETYELALAGAWAKCRQSTM